MNINQTLFKEIEPFLDRYDCDRRDVERCLNPPNIFERLLNRRHAYEIWQKEATNSFSAIMEPHGKRHLFEHLSHLAKIEAAMTSFLPKQRDHVVHSLVCFLLGIYINEKFFPKLGVKRVDNFQWEIAALFHDVGYSVEIANKAIIEPYNRIVETHSQSRKWSPFPESFTKISGNVNSLKVIQDQINRWHLLVNTELEFQKMLDEKETNHGIVSALSILKGIDSLYQEKNPTRQYFLQPSSDGIDWSQRWFVNDIIPACSAIFIHSLKEDCFIESKIELAKTPLAYLLKLSDALQEWDRPSKEDRGFSSRKFDISIEDTQLILFARIPNWKKTKIRVEIANYLADPHIEIR